MIQPYGLILFTAVTVGLFIFNKRRQQIRLTTSQLESLILYYLFSSIIGARLYHVITDYHLYQGNILKAFFFWQGGLGILGVISAGLVTTYIFSRRQKIPTLELLDSIAPALLAAQIIGRLANIYNQELLPFAYYEITYNSLLLFLMLGIDRLFKPSLGSGALTSIYLIGYGLGRTFLEELRAPRLNLGIISFTQLISIVLSLIGFLYLIKLISNRSLH